MKLHIGAVPVDHLFQSDAGNWLKIKEPGPWLLQFITIPIAALTAAFLIYSFYLTFPRVVPTSHRAFSFSFWQAIVLVLFMVPVHELLHAVCTPNLGRTEKTLVGVWPQKMMFFAYYTGVMTRNRFLVLLLAPFTVLSVLPLVVIALFWYVPINSAVFVFIVVLSVMNGVASSGDLLEAGLIFFQVPKGAVVRSQGWKIFWKPANQN